MLVAEHFFLTIWGDAISVIRIVVVERTVRIDITHVVRVRVVGSANGRLPIITPYIFPRRLFAMRV